MLKKLKSQVFMNATHFTALCRRYFALLFADKFAFFTLLFQAPIMVLVIYLGCSRNFAYWDACQTMFVISVILVIMATLNSYREICKERDVLIRETNVGLDSTAYVLSKVFVQGIICLYQSFIIVLGTSLLIKFNIHGFFPYIRYFLFTFLVLLTSTCVALFISAILKNSDSAILPVLFIIISQVVLSDAIIALPENIRFLTMFTVTRWAVGGYANIFDFAGLAKAMEYPPELRHIYNYSYATNVLVLLGVCVVCIALTIAAVSHLRKKKY